MTAVPPPNWLRILVIEDDMDDLALLRDYFSKIEGLSVSIDIMRSASEFERARHRDRYDLVLLDLHLPDSEGMADLFRLKRYCGGAPIIVVSGMEYPEFANLARSYGARDYVYKSRLNPNKIEELLSTYVIKNREELRMI